MGIFLVNIYLTSIFIYFKLIYFCLIKYTLTEVSLPSTLPGPHSHPHHLSSLSVPLFLCFRAHPVPYSNPLVQMYFDVYIYIFRKRAVVMVQSLAELGLQNQCKSSQARWCILKIMPVLGRQGQADPWSSPLGKLHASERLCLKIN